MFLMRHLQILNDLTDVQILANCSHTHYSKGYCYGKRNLNFLTPCCLMQSCYIQFSDVWLVNSFSLIELYFMMTPMQE